MTYRVFATLPGSTLENESDWATLIPFEFPTKDLAIDCAIKLLDQSAVVWRMDGPDGYLMDRRKVRKAYFKTTGEYPKN